MNDPIKILIYCIDGGNINQPKILHCGVRSMDIVVGVFDQHILANCIKGVIQFTEKIYLADQEVNKQIPITYTIVLEGKILRFSDFLVQWTYSGDIDTVSKGIAEDVFRDIAVIESTK